jgi:hypothetical protein
MLDKIRIFVLVLEMDMAVIRRILLSCEISVMRCSSWRMVIFGSLSFARVAYRLSVWNIQNQLLSEKSHDLRLLFPREYPES